MEIRTLKNGFKGEGDNPIEVKTDGWEKISNLELFKLIKLIYENEERIYPLNRGFDGGNRIKNAIYRLLDRNFTPEEVDTISKQKGVAKVEYGLKQENWERIFCDACGEQAFCDKCKKYIWRENEQN